MELSSEDLRLLDPRELLAAGMSLADLARLRREGRIPMPASTSAPPGDELNHRWQMPTKLPTFNPEKGKTNPRIHIQKIETIGACHRIPEPSRRLVLLSSLRGSAVEWAQEALPSALSWAETQQVFLQAYLTQDQELLDLQALDTTRQETSLVRDYGLKFIQLARRLNIPLEDRRLLLRFQRGLRPDIQTSFAMMMRTSPPADLPQAIQYARDIELSLRPLDEGHTPKRPRADLVCPLPGHQRHLKSDCRTLAAKRQKTPDAGSSSAASLPVPPPPPSTLPGSSSSDRPLSYTPVRDVSQVTCHRCKEKGHYANKCPNPAARQVNVQRGTSTLTPVSEIKSVEDWLGFEAQLAELEADEGSAPLLVSMIVSQGELQHTLIGEIDTGASHGFISYDRVTELHIPVCQKEGKITLASNDTRPRIGKTIPLGLRYGARRLEYAFEVMPLPVGVDMLIGRDLIRLLGIGITGLLAPTAEYPEPVPELSSSSIGEGNAAHPQQEELLLSIAEELKNNQALGPGFCTLASSEVRIPVPSGQYSYVRQYRTPYVWKDYVTETVTRWLDEGVIEKAAPGCPANNSLLCAPKREADGTISTTRCRVCIDIRGVNKLLPAMDNFPLPLIREIFEGLSGAEIYSVVDLDAAYNRLPVHLDDRVHVAFTWNNVQYWFKGAPFGLSFLPSHFCRVMSSILAEYSAFCRVYMDDIIIFSSSVELHAVHVQTVLQRLTGVNMRINSKSHFGLASVVLLGHVINQHGMAIDYRKLKGMDAWETPVSARQLQHYLGLFNYFREFIPKFSQVAAPLDQVRHSFQWGEPQQSAWHKIISLLDQAPLLHFPDFTRKFFLATDASTYGISAVLFQKDDQGAKQYISFKARALKGAERNYSATKLESLAMVYGCLQFRHYLLGRKFTLITDHQALCHLYNKREPNRISTGWFETLLEFDFDVTHIAGIQNVLPDHLSRIFSSGEERVATSTLENLQCNEVSINRSQTSVASESHEEVSSAHISGSQTNVASEPQPAFPSVTSSSSQTIVASHPLPPTGHDSASLGTVLVLQDDMQLRATASTAVERRKELLEQHHAFGHFGSKALVRSLKRAGHNWPNLLFDASKEVRNCLTCARHTIKSRGFHPVTPSFALLPFDHLAVDTISPNRVSDDGYLYILIVVDLATRFVLLRPLKTKLMEEIAQQFVELFMIFGIPKIIQSDNGSEFANQLITELRQRGGFEHRFTTPYHPMANGVVERHVGTVMSVLRKHLQGNENDWVKYLSLTQLEVNNHEHTLTGSSPFSLMFGRSLQIFDDSVPASQRVMNETAIQERFALMHQLVYPSIAERVREKQVRDSTALNKKRKLVDFPIGSFVMVKDTFRKGKLSPIYEGPYKVIRKTKGGSYSLLDHDNLLLPRNFAPSQLTLVAPQERIDDTSYIIEAILDHRGGAGDYEYLVKWRGFASTENSWISEDNFDDVGIIAAYWRTKQEERPTPPKRKTTGRTKRK